ncbi:Cell morphogenesis protein PAG1 [Recurvomyces mirabilis]|uniref:Cell morphogenesis protein PAG1 n=1 Tax=Recurvomyces mirabilis TaxID=574656 RepID=A0AAE0WU36_9PEZI|nr:Cell morphogenesis protein PAG1 [Recurvomyces mirabilis]KAK5160745.1 Cell morphogenesis protein PAG1 [Recurvomyces mirabilis]
MSEEGPPTTSCLAFGSVPSPSTGRAIPISATHAPLNTSSSAIDLSSSPPPEPLLIAPPTAPFAAARDHAGTRGRALSATSPQNGSPRGLTPSGQVRSKQSLEVERKPSLYGHHRQTSIVHGVQHSRNASLLASTNTSPLSPHRAMANGAVENAAGNGAPILKKSPSMSTLHSNGHGLPGNRSFENAATHRRPERMHSGRVKRSHEHNRSQSRVHGQQELKTVGEYALHHLFTSFIAEADDRIERCIPRAGEPEPRVENICGPGADISFDQLISSLGHINRHKPNSLIDSVIHWRKKKADIANNLYIELQKMRESAMVTQRGVTQGIAPPPINHDVVMKEQEMSLADSRSTISIYILCRVLIEIIGQTTLKALNGPDGNLNTAGRLEDVIYGQLQSADPDLLLTSPVIHANWEIRGQLLGVMSGVRFAEVADRFVKDLERAQQRLSIKGLADPRLATKTALLVKSMRWLKVHTKPDDAWSHACDTMRTLAKFFAEVHGRVMKHAYAELFERLMLPIAANATSELNSPRWREVVNIIQPKLTQMLSKADHWPYIYPLQAVLLCVSPGEQFANQWLPLITSVQPKARDRAGRSHTLKAVCRLVWRYLYRLSDSRASVARKLDEIVRLVFQGGKRVLISTDPVIADPLIQLIRIIGFSYQDLCFRTIIFPLMNAELFSGPERDLRIENLDPEKTVIAIRAFLAVMSDLEKGEAPPFPTGFECDALTDPSTRSPMTHRRTRSQGFAVSAGRTELLSRPVMIANLDDITKEYYNKFCQILGKLTIICDNTFGGQAVLEEKFASHTPKTPMAEAFNFTKREDFLNPTDLRQHYYDLLHVAVEALPRCLSPHLPITPLVNLLCTGTAHVQSHIANSSAQSLKSIARQSHAQQVTIGFARFIFNFDDRYATVSDGSLLGPGHIENTLKLYVELLQIWIDDIQQRTRKVNAEPAVDDADSTTRQLPLDLSGILAHVDEVESHGLFFLCSPSRVVRAIAVTVLRLINKFDTALGKPTRRIISILEGSSQQVIDVNDERLSLAERSRLQKGLRKSNLNSTLVELCSSEIAHDTNLWFKLFPNLIQLSSQLSSAVTLTRELVCLRLSHSHKNIANLADGFRSTPYNAIEQAFAPVKPAGRVATSAPDVIIEQWKIHLVFACTTLTNTGGSANHAPAPSQSSQHTRKSSKSSATSQDKIASANELFSRVVPFLAVANAAIRGAAAVGLGATNVDMFPTLLECLQPYVAQCSSEAKERLNAHQRSVSIPRRSRRTDFLRTEITHLLSLTCQQLQLEKLLGQEYPLTYIVDYTKHLRLFLSDTEIQGELEFQKLRTHYCTLVETFYETARKVKDSSRWVSFQSRQATFALMENWCGFSPHEPQLRRQEDHLRRSLLDREQDLRSRGIVNSALEKEKSELQLAALSAMAALCAGPLNFVADKKILMQFDVRRMLTWVSSIFDSPSDRMHAIGRRALQNLIVHNVDQPYIMAQTLRMCYIARTPKALTSYFEVVTKVLTDHENVTTPFWKILCAGLYTLGNEDSNIRMRSERLLRTLEERQGKTSKLQDLDISVSDKTTAVYKLAQFEISRRLSKQHPELAFHVFSEFSAYFNELQPDHQRNMVTGMLPWIQTIELQLDPNGGPTATSYMLLVNLFEITAKSSITLHNEIQALWQALATGPYAGNVQLVLDFIIMICLERKEHNFVLYAKQVVVFLSKTPAGARVVEYLLLQIHPKTMVAERREPAQAPIDTAQLPYIADLALVLPGGAKQTSMSLGQLSMILLVDLVVSPIQLPADKVPTLLQVVLVQWDQYVSIVQDQAKEMLVHLIHELVISKIEPGSTEPDKKSIEDFIDSVRTHDPKIMWSYTDSEIRAGEETSRAVSESMAYVVDEVVKIFSVTYPGLREEWGKVTMQWATSCAVRHIACRSFQVFRCISTTLDQQMLADMLARLSNTIADDENHDYLIFSLEILTTLRSIIDALTPLDLLAYPQLFWTTCACLDTIFEREFQEGMSMLSLLLTKMDLSDPAVLKILRESQPAKWEGGFQGMHSLLFKGVRSSTSMKRTLDVMEQLIKLPSGDIVGFDDRLLFTLLANLPRYLHYFDSRDPETDCRISAETLGYAAESHGHAELAEILLTFAKGETRSRRDFLSRSVKAIRAAYLPALEFHSLVFLLGMVNNQVDWFKVTTMQVLCVIVPDVDMRKPEFASQGPDLISPLLRLLQTDHCQQALEVLDNVIEMTGTPLDNKHLRMSMAGSHSSRATRKEYESTKSLYGIPEESGWSIPMPAIHSAQTRSNVHAVFYTLAYTGLGGVQEENASPDIEFHSDDYGYDSYFTDRTGTMMSDDTRADGNMGELAEKLEDLDDFFDEPKPSPVTDGYSRNSTGHPDERARLYNEQTLPILQSLKRNPSVTSFQGGFATSEMRYPPAQKHTVMNPGAFAQKMAPPARPGLHNRSITSPAMPLKRSPPRLANDIMSGDEAGDEPEPFSDDDSSSSFGRSNTGDDPPLSAQHTVKASGLRGWKQGLRRLTSSGNTRQDVPRSLISATQKSPKVPRVPQSWLLDPMSGEP